MSACLSSFVIKLLRSGDWWPLSRCCKYHTSGGFERAWVDGRALFPAGQCRPPKIIYCLSVVSWFAIVLDVRGRVPCVARPFNNSAMPQKTAASNPDVKDTGEEKIE